MAQVRLHPSSREAWGLAHRQHGVITREQLCELGFTPEAIEHRIRVGRLHRLARGVYAVGRPEVGRYGLLMASVLSCGRFARISHGSAGWLWGIAAWGERIDVVVPTRVFRRRPGIRVHRRLGLPDEGPRVRGIPVTDPVDTLIDLASEMADPQLERAIREADALDLVDPETLREALDRTAWRRLPAPGSGRGHLRAYGL